MKKKKFLITGSSGMIGSALVRKLKKDKKLIVYAPFKKKLNLLKGHSERIIKTTIKKHQRHSENIQHPLYRFQLRSHLQKCTILKQVRLDAEKPGNQKIGMGTTSIHHKRPSWKHHIVTTNKNKEITSDKIKRKMKKVTNPMHWGKPKL